DLEVERAVARIDLVVEPAAAMERVERHEHVAFVVPGSEPTEDPHVPRNGEECREGGEREAAPGDDEARARSPDRTIQPRASARRSFQDLIDRRGFPPHAASTIRLLFPTQGARSGSWFRRYERANIVPCPAFRSPSRSSTVTWIRSTWNRRARSTSTAG